MKQYKGNTMEDSWLYMFPNKCKLYTWVIVLLSNSVIWCIKYRLPSRCIYKITNKI